MIRGGGGGRCRLAPSLTMRGGRRVDGKPYRDGFTITIYPVSVGPEQPRLSTALNGSQRSYKATSRCSVNSAITPRRFVVARVEVQDDAAGEALQRVRVGLCQTCTPAAQELSGVAGCRDQRRADRRRRPRRHSRRCRRYRLQFATASSTAVCSSEASQTISNLPVEGL